MEDFYQILGVSPKASLEEIKERFRFLAQAYHPDKFASTNHKAQAEEQFKRINEAYQVLSDPRKRAEYDGKRFAQPSWFEEEERRQREQAEAERRRAESEQWQREQAETERRRADYQRQQRERTASPSPPSTVVASNKSPITAALLSFFLFGGVGQIYLGQKKKGVALIVATFLTALFGVSSIVILSGTIDAYGIAKKMNQGISVGDWEFSFSGKALIVILVIVGVIIGIYVLASIGTQTR